MDMETEPARMTASEASALIQSKRMSCEELVRSCLARIASRDAVVKAWLRLDADYVIRRARELDKLPSKGGVRSSSASDFANKLIGNIFAGDAITFRCFRQEKLRGD